MSEKDNSHRWTTVEVAAGAALVAMEGPDDTMPYLPRVAQEMARAVAKQVGSFKQAYTTIAYEVGEHDSLGRPLDINKAAEYLTSQALKDVDPKDRARIYGDIRESLLKGSERAKTTEIGLSQNRILRKISDNTDQQHGSIGGSNALVGPHEWSELHPNFVTNRKVPPTTY